MLGEEGEVKFEFEFCRFDKSGELVVAEGDPIGEEADIGGFELESFFPFEEEFPLESPAVVVVVVVVVAVVVPPVMEDLLVFPCCACTDAIEDSAAAFIACIRLLTSLILAYKPLNLIEKETTEEGNEQEMQCATLYECKCKVKYE